MIEFLPGSKFDLGAGGETTITVQNTFAMALNTPFDINDASYSIVTGSQTTGHFFALPSTSGCETGISLTGTESIVWGTSNYYVGRTGTIQSVVTLSGGISPQSIGTIFSVFLRNEAEGITLHAPTPYTITGTT